MTSSAGPPSILQPIKRIIAFLPTEDWIVIGWVIAIKTLLFLSGVKSYPMLWDRYAPTPNRWFELWDQWDFGYYQKIAEFGYERGDGSLAFYPLFPCLLRFVAYFTGSYLVAGLIVSGIAPVAAAVLLAGRCNTVWSGVALRSVCFFLFFRQLTFLRRIWRKPVYCSGTRFCPGCARRSMGLPCLLGAFCG